MTTKLTKSFHQLEDLLLHGKRCNLTASLKFLFNFGFYVLYHCFFFNFVYLLFIFISLCTIIYVHFFTKKIVTISTYTWFLTFSVAEAGRPEIIQIVARQYGEHLPEGKWQKFANRPQHKILKEEWLVLSFQFPKTCRPFHSVIKTSSRTKCC